MADRDDVNFYCVLVFRNNAERGEFSQALGLADNKWQDGSYVRRRLTAPQSPAPSGAPTKKQKSGDGKTAPAS